MQERQGHIAIVYLEQSLALITSGSTTACSPTSQPQRGGFSYQTPSIFMFVWSPVHSQDRSRGSTKTTEDFEQSFRYWLKFLASKTRKSRVALKVIVVLTRADQTQHFAQALSPSIHSLRSRFKGIIDIISDKPFEVDARKKDSVRDVGGCIFRIAKQLLEGVQVYKVCTEANIHLRKHLKKVKKRIIPWPQFRDLCVTAKLFSPGGDVVDEAHQIMEAIALCLNESGIIIYINSKSHIVLDPDWFCRRIIGSLVHDPMASSASTASKSSMKVNGFVPRSYLAAKLKSSADSSEADDQLGSLLVDLMEAMHLCCRVPASASGSASASILEERLFIPATFTDPKDLRLEWRSSRESAGNVYDSRDHMSSAGAGYAYMGRRLECRDKDLTFLTPGLFPTIQVLFYKEFALGAAADQSDVRLGKEYISICMPDTEILVIFCKSGSDHVIDVLVRMLNYTDELADAVCTARSLAFVEQHVVGSIVTMCAQPKGSQGVDLIESAISPRCLKDPSAVHLRNDRCHSIALLKKELRKQLDEGCPGERACHLWKETKHVRAGSTDALRELLGPQDYCEAYKQWLREMARAGSEAFGKYVADQESQGIVHGSYETWVDTVNAIESKVRSTGSSASKGIVTLAAVQNDVAFIKEMVVEILKEVHAVKSMVGGLHSKVDEMHKKLETTRNGLLQKVKEDVNRLLNFAMDDEAAKQLPRLLLPAIGAADDAYDVVARLVRGEAIHLRLLCEDRAAGPHEVEGQTGLNFVSLSESSLVRRAVPYVRMLAGAINLAAKPCIGVSLPVPDSSPFVKVKRQYLSLSEHLKEASHRRHAADHRGADNIGATESCREWQRCLAAMLEENGGVTDDNISRKFGLKRARYKSDGSNAVAWLCDEHYKQQKPFPLSG